MSLQIAHAHLINYVFYHLLFDLKFYMKQCISIRPFVIILRLDLILQKKKTKIKLQIPRSKFENEKKNNQQPYKKTKKKKHTKKTIAN